MTFVNKDQMPDDGNFTLPRPRLPRDSLSSGLSCATRCLVVPPSPTYGRLMARGAYRFARGRGVRGSASEKLELIRLVEGSSLSIRRTLTEIGLAALDVFRLVQALPGRRTGGARRPQATLPVRLEPDPGADSGAGDRDGPGAHRVSRRASWLAGSRTERASFSRSRASPGS